MSEYVLSFSGGKNSTAMLILCKQLGIKLDGIVFADTGAELPETYEFIARAEDWAKQKIDIVRDCKGRDFFDWFYLPLCKGKRQGERHGFPYNHYSAFNGPNWCTRSLKIDPIAKYANGRTQLVGMAADEWQRRRRDREYPLQDWRLTSLDCYNICVENDLLNPIYHRFGRSGCWTCPNQSKRQLRLLYAFYPHLWQRLLQMEQDSPTRFSMDYTLAELNALFLLELGPRVPMLQEPTP